MATQTTRTRVRRPLQRSERCSHLAAEPTGTTEARQLHDGSWLYQAAYRCPACGAHFTERHAQSLARNVGDAVV